MEKEHFKNLLEDLYKIYNPHYLQYLEYLTDKNFRMPNDAIEMIIVKYNSPNAQHHDPDKNKPEYRENLINSYSNGNRILENLDVLAEAKNRTEHTEDKKSQELQREREKLKKEIDEIKQIKKDLLEKKEPEHDWSDAEVIVQLNYKEEEVLLPPVKYMAQLGIGGRIVTTTKSGRAIGLSIKDILLDYETLEMTKKVSLMIFIDKE